MGKNDRQYAQSPEEEAASKKAKGARVKGKAYEKDLFDFFKAELKDFHVNRGNQAGKGGKGNPDLLLQGAVRTIHVEAKKGKRVRIREAYRQALSDARATDTPTVCWKDDREADMVCLSLVDFTDLLNLTSEQDRKSGVVRVIAPPGIRIEREES